MLVTEIRTPTSLAPQMGHKMIEFLPFLVIELRTPTSVAPQMGHKMFKFLPFNINSVAMTRRRYNKTEKRIMTRRRYNKRGKVTFLTEIVP